MAGTAEYLESLLVKLVGDNADYVEMLMDAEAQAAKAAKTLEAHARMIEQQTNETLREAARLTQEVITPTEHYAQEAKRLHSMLANGHITLETYNRQLDELSKTLPEVQRREQQLARAQQASNQRFREARGVIESVMTPTERYEKSVARLDRLLRAKMLTEEQHARAISKLKQTLPEVVRQEERRAASLARANQIVASVRTPLQSYKRELAELNRLYARGMIDASTYAKATAKVRHEYDLLGKKLGRVQAGLERVSSGLKSAGATMSIAITAPLVAAGTAMARTFAQFEANMTELAGAAAPTAEQLRQIEKAALATSIALRIRPSEVVEGFTELLKAGMSVEDVLNGAGEAAIKFAEVGRLETAVAATIMADAMVVFGEDAKRTGDILSAAADASSISIKQIAESFTQVAAVAGNANQTLNETAAAIAILGKNGVKGSDAGTALKTMLLRLMTPADKGAKIVEKYNIQLRDSNKQMLKLPDLIQELQRKLGGLNDEARDRALYDLFGQDAIRAGQIFLRTGAEGFREMQQQMNSANTIAQKYQLMLGTLSKKWEGLVAAVQRFGIVLMTALNGSMTNVIETVTNIIDRTAKWVENNQELAATLAKIAIAAAALGPILVIAGSIAGAFSNIVGAVSTTIRLFDMLKKSQMAASAGAMGLKAGLVILTAYISYQVGTALANWLYGLRNVNAEIEKSRRLQNELMDRESRQRNKVLEEASSITDTGERKEFLNEQLKEAENFMEGLEMQVKMAKKEMDRLEPTWLSLGQAGKKLWEQAQREHEEARARLESGKKWMTDLRDEIERTDREAERATKRVENVKHMMDPALELPEEQMPPEIQEAIDVAEEQQEMVPEEDEEEKKKVVVGGRRPSTEELRSHYSRVEVLLTEIASNTRNPVEVEEADI